MQGGDAILCTNRLVAVKRDITYHLTLHLASESLTDSVALTFAPAQMRAITASARPFSAATIIAVLWSCNKSASALLGISASSEGNTRQGG